MRIFNEVGRWYSIPCKILTQVIYVKKNFKSTEKNESYHPDTDPQTDGRTDGRTDRRKDEQGESSISPPKLHFGGYNQSMTSSQMNTYATERAFLQPNLTGGHRTRVAAVTLDNMAERVFAQREDCLNSAVLIMDFLGISDSIR